MKPVIFGVLQLTFEDDYEGVVDLRPVLADGPIFAFLRESPKRFEAVQREAHGHAVFWIDDDGDTVDFGADSLRRDAEKQAALITLAS
ncbi:hypothetical protein [Bauldia sp.]|uniref:hypothetical protein n=1 Tax=Bauldia sp. TaxID=2575872 RepID=UPI003BA8AB53